MDLKHGDNIFENIRMLLIENNVTKVTVWHREACRVISNSYPKWRNFQFAPNNHYRFFFKHTLPLTIEFKLEYVLCYQFYAEISTFSIMKCLVRLLSMTTWYHAWGGLTPPGIIRKYPEQVKIMENLVGYARKKSKHFVHIRLLWLGGWVGGGGGVYGLSRLFHSLWAESIV